MQSIQSNYRSPCNLRGTQNFKWFAIAIIDLTAKTESPYNMIRIKKATNIDKRRFKKIMADEIEPSDTEFEAILNLYCKILYLKGENHAN